jgi:hypothetical protein
MQMKSEFDSLVERMGLGEDERTLAEIFWKRAEKAMVGKNGQEAILLGGEPLNLTLFKFTDKDDLTQDELNFMIDLNRDALKNHCDLQIMIKGAIKSEWEVCDPDNPETLKHFKLLNRYKYARKKLKRQANMLANIQRKLKKMKGTH